MIEGGIALHVLFMCEIAVRLTFSVPKIPSQAVTMQRLTPEIRHGPSKEIKLLYILETVGSIRRQDSKYPERFLDFFQLLKENCWII
jgi:hypothetical protein